MPLNLIFFYSDHLCFSASLVFAFHFEFHVRFEISLLSLEQQLSLTRGPPHIVFAICLVSVKAYMLYSEFYAKRLLVDIHIRYVSEEQQLSIPAFL